MKKPKRKLSAAEKAEKRRRRKEYMTIFINGKQKRVKRPPTIEGLPVDEFIRQNADPIWLHLNEMWEYMTMEVDFDEVKTAALQLSIKERAQLAGKLLLSLDESSESEIKRLWLDEAERRQKEYREGRIQGIPTEDVFRRAIDDRS